MANKFAYLAVAVALSGCAGDRDPFLWLEDVEGDQPLAWVEERNRKARETLAASPSFAALEQRLLAILDADDRIPYLSKAGDWHYNFWQDERNPRGLWRRTSLEEYRKEEPAWEIVLDIDALGAREGENWVFGGARFLEPSYDRCLVELSRGGADAEVTREFDLTQKTFVEDGFFLPEAKGSAAWAGPDRLLVATDFGPGSTTESGYPRIVKLWRRGQALEEAETVFEGQASDVSVGAFADLTPGYALEFIYRAWDFHNTELYIRRNGALIQVEKPSDAEASVHRGRLFIEPKSDWPAEGRTYPAGSLLAIDLERFLAGDRNLDILFQPEPGKALASYQPTRNHVLINVLDNVRNRVYVATPTDEGWAQRPLNHAGAEGFRTLSVGALDPNEDDRYFLQTTDYLRPPTLYLGAVGEQAEVLKRAPALFDAQGLEIAQHWATSADGTRIPYFQVSSRAAAGPQPTLLYGYGGFEISLLPRYSAIAGAAWLERGGVYVVANIRGGGEFGPAWHRAALKARRTRAYQDFIAVAEHLAQRGVTTAAQLGAMGGSNGGLLMGNMLTMRPDLFGAIVAQVPLFDMRRYHRLLAGASWVAEYGDPDLPEEWAFLRGFSPYHNLRPEAQYPPLLVTTSTRDDRVHPGHARKLVAQMERLGHEVLYFENVEGGHAGAADNAQRAFMWALAYQFLWRVLAGEE